MNALMKKILIAVFAFVFGGVATFLFVKIRTQQLQIYIDDNVEYLCSDGHLVGMNLHKNTSFDVAVFDENEKNFSFAFFVEDDDCAYRVCDLDGDGIPERIFFEGGNIERLRAKLTQIKIIEDADE